MFASTRLLLEDERRSADSVGYEGDGHLNAVGNLDKRNAAIHSELLTVKGHSSCNFAVTAAFCSRDDQVQCFGLGDSANRECARNVKGVGAGLHNLSGVKGNVGILLDVEEIFAL